MFKVVFTASKYTEESLNHGDSDSNGYIDMNWNRFQFLEEDDEWAITVETLEEAEATVEEYIGETTKERDTYYAQDSISDDEGNVWSYAAHVEEVA